MLSDKEIADIVRACIADKAELDRVIIEGEALGLRQRSEMLTAQGKLNAAREKYEASFNRMFQLEDEVK